MKVGILFPFRNPPKWGKPFPRFYDEQLALVQEAEKLGYDEIWLTEHHFAEDGYTPALMPIAGAIARMTTRIRIGTFLILMPLHNALQLAEEVAIVDILSNGRFDLGLGQGYSKMEFDGFGVSLSDRVSLLREGVDVLRGAWTQDDFSYKGKHYDLKHVMLSPRPVQQPHPPIWVGASIDKAAGRVAEMDCHFLGGAPGPQKVYDATLRASGKNPDDYKLSALRWCYIAPSRDQAWDDCQEHLHYMINWYREWTRGNLKDERPEMPSPDQMRYMDMNTLQGRPIIGTPDDLLEEVEKMASASRVTDLILGMCLPGLAPEKIRASMELVSRHALPRLNEMRSAASSA